MTLERPEYPYPRPTVEPPSMEEIQDVILENDHASTTDGCYPIEPDGWCEHGHVSWLVYFGLI